MNRSRIGRSSISCLGLLTFLCPSLGAQLAFDDVAAATGTTIPSFGRGAAMVDLDGDGLLDLVTANDGMDNFFLRQLPDHTFQIANLLWGVAVDSRATYSVLVADFDNDGDSDVYFVNGGFFGYGQSDQYLRNDLDTLGVFTDVPAGAATQPSTNFGGTVLDYDRDGDLDIFVTTSYLADGACLLLENDGNAQFTDVSQAAGITHAGHFRHCTMGDFDNDGWPDVAVGGWLRNRLYRNQGDGTFAEVSESLGLDFPNNSNFGLVLEDFNSDGWLDVYVPRYQYQGVTGPSQLLVNDGAGSFLDVTSTSGISGQEDMGHSTGDFDSDGFPEIYIGTGSPNLEKPDVLYRILPDGSGGLTATDISLASGILAGGLTRCHGMAIGDYDQDGFVDIYVNNGGPDWSLDLLEENFLWKNQGNGAHWTDIRLTGVLSNRDGIGARAMAVGDTGTRVYCVRRSGHGFGNSDSPILHFGMGTAQSVERIEIQWPSGIEQLLLAPGSEQITDVLETGMRLVGQPSIGSVFQLQMAGAPDFVVHLFLSTSVLPFEIELPAFGGALILAPPITTLGLTQLDTDGVGAIPIFLPNQPAIVGSELSFQAWIHPLDSLVNSAISGLVTVKIEP